MKYFLLALMALFSVTSFASDCETKVSSALLSETEMSEDEADDNANGLCFSINGDINEAYENSETDEELLTASLSKALSEFSDETSSCSEQADLTSENINGEKRQLVYNWFFEVKQYSAEDAERLTDVIVAALKSSN